MMPYQIRLTIAALVALVSLLVGTPSAHAQDSERIESSGGRLYVVAFPDTTRNTFDSRYPNKAYLDKAILFIYSAVDATVSIKGRRYDTTVTTVGGSFRIVELMTGLDTTLAPIVTEHCRPINNTFRLESDAAIVVYQYIVTRFGTEAWTPLPVEAWGNEYYAAAKEGEIASDVSPGGEFDYNRKNKMAPAEILVIAAYDNTRITIVPNGQVHNFCPSQNVLLMAGEAYQIQSWVDTLTANVGGDQPDFGGSRIFSTKPVGVISGNTRAQTIDENVGLGKNIFKNMLIEWISPVEQHGTEFVYMPTSDSLRPTGAPEEDPAEKRKAEFVRVYGTQVDSSTTGYFMQNGVAVPYDAPIEVAKWAQIRHTPNLARVHRTDRPAQAFMHSAAVVKYAGTTQGFGGYIGAAYDGWGGYMVELTPRERWVSFVPFYASSHPGGMEHRINVVTDTMHRNDVYLRSGNRFEFTTPIEGTDLIWGTMAVQPGVDHWLEGRNGAKVAGYVYGTLTRGGHEEYRPGRIRSREEDAPGLANRGDAGDDGTDVGGAPTDGGTEPLHPSEHEEKLGISYGYPIASAHMVMGAGDSLGIKTVVDCKGMCLTIEALNATPVGLRSVWLDDAVNATVLSQNPLPVTGAVKATACIAPLDATRDASATVVIMDKTGRTTRVPYAYAGERVDLDTTNLDFGAMTPGLSQTLELTISNPLDRSVTIERTELIKRNPAFTIKAPTSFPITLAPNGTVKVVVEATPPRPNQTYRDTILVKLGCVEKRVPVSAITTNPCVRIGDLDFGVLPPGTSLTLMLRISNDGTGIVEFDNPAGGPELEWMLDEFEVSAADLSRLEGARLAGGDSIEIAVTFRATETGTYRDTARLWASVRTCRDTSFWTARVDPSVSAPVELAAVTALEAVTPNPTAGPTVVRYALARGGRVTIVLYDERGARVTTLLDAERASGSHTVSVDASQLAPGVYHVRLESAGVGRSRSFIRK